MYNIIDEANVFIKFKQVYRLFVTTVQAKKPVVQTSHDHVSEMSYRYVMTVKI